MQHHEAKVERRGGEVTWLRVFDAESASAGALVRWLGNLTSNLGVDATVGATTATSRCAARAEALRRLRFIVRRVCSRSLTMACEKKLKLKLLKKC